VQLPWVLKAIPVNEMFVKNPNPLLVFCLGTCLGITATQVHAATVTSLPGGAGTAPGITYEWLVEDVSNNDNVNFVRDVGAKSWNEPNNPVGLKGWTHTSNWVALELLQPSILTIEIARQANVGTAGNSLYPAFSLYSGWDNQGVEDHEFNTLGNTAWADGIDYIGHEGNAGAATAISRSFNLPAGLYSIAIGGNPPTDVTGRQGYLAVLSTAPIPEPSANTGLFIVALGAILRLAQRQGVN